MHLINAIQRYLVDSVEVCFVFQRKIRNTWRVLNRSTIVLHFSGWNHRAHTGVCVATS